MKRSHTSAPAGDDELCQSEEVTEIGPVRALPKARRVDVDADLPECCRATPLRLPRPRGAVYEATGGMDVGTAWDLGLDAWTLKIGVSWDDEHDQLTAAVASHMGVEDAPQGALIAALADHGIEFDAFGQMWVGSQELVTASLYNDLNRAAGRMCLHDGRSLFDAADSDAADLGELVAPLVNLFDEEVMWSDDVVDVLGEEVESTDLAIFLRSVRITPILRGHGLGAWAAAQAVALFDHGRSVVATLAAPLSRRDGIPGFTDDHQDLTPAEEATWLAAQNRLARYWSDRLGLVPLEEEPSILVWHSQYRNEALEASLALWR